MEPAFPDTSVKPFRMNRIPPYPLRGAQLAEDSENAIQNLADVLGCTLSQARNDIRVTCQALMEDGGYREKFGAVNSQPFGVLASLSPEAQDAALKVAELAMNQMIEAFAGTLVAGARTVSDDYAVTFKLEAQLQKITATTAENVQLKRVLKCVVADEKQGVLLNSLARWRRIFAKSDT